MDTPLRDAPVMLLALESLVTLSLFAEVILRAVVLGSEYLRSWSNLLDSLAAAASAALLFWAAPRASRRRDFEGQKEDVELSQSLVMARIIVQFCRLLLIAQRAKRSHQASGADRHVLQDGRRGRLGSRPGLRGGAGAPAPGAASRGGLRAVALLARMRLGPAPAALWCFSLPVSSFTCAPHARALDASTRSGSMR
ncbi:unnamed protein product, partial [Prorocentrum cordatum]